MSSCKCALWEASKLFNGISKKLQLVAAAIFFSPKVNQKTKRRKKKIPRNDTY